MIIKLTSGAVLFIRLVAAVVVAVASPVGRDDASVRTLVATSATTRLFVEVVAAVIVAVAHKDRRNALTRRTGEIQG